MTHDKGRLLMLSKNTLLIFLGGFITAGVLIMGIIQKIASCCGDSGSAARK